ncbi:HalOD1 output domain-containing protein [Halosolutus halophilus]|uniref:HalOD1 output domain-containing protein n=1 Tax=Halosolutus halophilus TaxID=1552990 RepID=UPI0031F334DD
MATETRSTCCECTPVGETRFGEERGRPPSLAIVEAVAAVEGVAPTEFDPLYETIDPESIDQLFTDSGNTSTPASFLRLSVAGWNVFVRGDGVIRVCDPDQMTDPASAFHKPLRE